MKQNVLVFPCGSEIGLEIYRSLCASTHFNLIGGSSTPDHGEFAFTNYIGDLPRVDAPDFTEKINAAIEEYKIDFIFPAHDSVVLRLAHDQAQGKLNCKVVTSPVGTCEVARYKRKTYELFEGVIPTPKIYNAQNLQASDLPVFLKPNVGQGSKGTYLAKELEDIAFYTKKDPSLLLLEYLPGKEFTIDCFTDKDGKLLFCEGRERVRIQNGISVNSASVQDDRFEKMARLINEKLEFRGVWFFQVKENKDKKLVLMEVAPRVAGAMGLVRCKGVNLPLLSLFDANGMAVGVFENTYNMVIDRALENTYEHDIDYKHVYLDFDDLVIFDGKVNPRVMAFVYQCINKGVKVHLLTRHKEDLNVTLKKYRLHDTFDELIWVQGDDEKHLYIKDKDAIFIDDSFAERKKVHDECRVPVFDGHMIEGLMEA
jgi:hypothetical protein